MDEVCRSCTVLLVSIPDLGFAFLESCLFECMLSITCDRNQTQGHPASKLSKKSFEGYF